MKMKTFIFLILVLTAFVFAFPASTQQATTVSIGDVSAMTNSSVTMPIMVNNVTNLGAGRINVTYNPSVVHVTGVASGTGNALICVFCNIASSPDLVQIFALDANKPHSGNVIFANVTYKAVGHEGSSSPLNITVRELGDYNNYTWIPHATISGTFTITPTGYPAPNITSFLPLSPVYDTEGATRVFNITINQMVNVSWQINGTQVYPNISVTGASYTNSSAVAGYWNVSAVASNVNGTDMQTWIWTVEKKPSPCYIATATYGTPLDGRIDVLRDFRDEVLMTNPIGEAFVSTYYRTSPPIADALRENEGLRTVTRLTLIDPLVSLSKFALNGILLVFIIGLTAVLSFRKDRMKILKSLLAGMGSILVFIAVIFSLGFVGYAIPFWAMVGAYLLPLVIPLSVVFTLCTLLKLHINVSGGAAIKVEEVRSLIHYQNSRFKVQQLPKGK